MSRETKPSPSGILLGDQGDDTVYLFVDNNGDGDDADVAETNILASRAFDDDALDRPRAVEFYEAPPLDLQIADNSTLGGGNHFSLFLDRESNTVYAAGAPDIVSSNTWWQQDDFLI